MTAEKTATKEIKARNLFFFPLKKIHFGFAFCSFSVIIYSLVLCNRSLTCLTTLNLYVFPLKKCSENTKSSFHFIFFHSLWEYMNCDFSLTVANSSLAINYMGSRFGTLTMSVYSLIICWVWLYSDQYYLMTVTTGGTFQGYFSFHCHLTVGRKYHCEFICPSSSFFPNQKQEENPWFSSSKSPMFYLQHKPCGCLRDRPCKEGES